MDSIQQFWWNWWMNGAIALATFLAVIVALFGDWFRAWFQSKFWPPMLELNLLSAEGVDGKIKYEAQKGPNTPATTFIPERFEDARYYHLRVSNPRRHISPAKDVQVFLMRIEEPGPGGELQVTWAGEVPMRWRDQQLYPLTRDVGRDADCDLCTVGKDGSLSLSPLIAPFTSPVRREKACDLVLSLQARSAQLDSPIHRVRIAWNGHWDDGETEMKRNLVIRELPLISTSPNKDHLTKADFK